jgi:oxygen-independent coproporphyrinogen III oxidase
MSGLYLHFPFCHSKCIYCSFYSVVSDKQLDQFYNSLAKELILRKNELNNERIETIYFGGGTPSLIPPQELKKIIDLIYSQFQISNSVEFTMETNPEQCSVDYLDDILKLGINRISIGIQSFDDHILHYLGRKHSSEQAIKAVLNAHSVGFNNISIDLIYGIPLRTASQWKTELQRAFLLPIQHLSAYALTIEENSILIKALKKSVTNFNIGKDQDEEVAFRDLKILQKQINKVDFCQYEISNFAIPGFESLHNSNYWNNTPYLGLGPSAHSYNGKSRSWNISSITQYAEKINKGEPFFESENLTLIDHYNEAIMLGLRTKKGVLLTEISKKFGEELYGQLLRNISFLDQKLFEIAENYMILTEEGLAIADYISEKLFASED